MQLPTLGLLLETTARRIERERFEPLKVEREREERLGLIENKDDEDEITDVSV